MKKISDDQFLLSAGDLVNHTNCEHLTHLDILVASDAMKKPDYYDPLLESLRIRGDLHEQAFIQHLKDNGHDVTTIEGVDINDSSFKSTIDAMQRGDEIIVQASLLHGNWRGRADILRRVEKPSKFGNWSYEVLDTKLARETKGGTVLQLCLYADLLSNIQGLVPDYIYVVSPWSDFEPQRFRFVDYAAYFRQMKLSTEQSILDTDHVTYPDPNSSCDVCRWKNTCDKRRRDDDHLSIVANITKNQIKELKSKDIQTIKALSEMPLPIAWNPKTGSKASLEKAKHQAVLQVKSRENNNELLYEILDINDDFGLSKLPPPSNGDVFFDIESNQFVGEHGIEYLFGYVYLDASNEQVYEFSWALKPEQEKSIFENFIKIIMERLEEFPDMHIYHYAPYEPAALKRLMGRYATCEDEVDRLLRGNVFVDLFSVLKNTLRASVESYSIKKMEPFYQYSRKISLHDANVALTKVSSSLEFDKNPQLDNADKLAVEKYNADDCYSTLVLRSWLEEIRSELIKNGENIERPDISDGQASEELDERQLHIQELIRKLTGDVPIIVDERTKEQHARWILAYILDWHRREDKANWWEYFRLSDLGTDDLLQERAAISNLRFIETIDTTKTGIPIDRYSFESQLSDVLSGDSLKMQGGDGLGTVDNVDYSLCTLDIKKSKKTADIHPDAIFLFKNFSAKEQASSLLRLGEYVVENGIEGEGDYYSACALLLRQLPDTDGQVIRNEDENTLDAALRFVETFEEGVFPIQGPPGTGKSYTAARMICQLVKQGKSVGVTANSHKVISNLLDKVVEASGKMDVSINCVQKLSSKEDERTSITIVTKNDDVFNLLNSGESQVAGATSFLWAREEAQDSLDVLVVDEAAQMSLANVLAVSHVAPALILLGDPQQLEQPTQGSHPEGTESSALDYILDGKQTITKEQGLFLDTTWRMYPSICSFNSALFYEGKLNSIPECRKQKISSEGFVKESGLYHFSVVHEGNTNSSLEEAEMVLKLVENILNNKTLWTDRESKTTNITYDDILIIAPYNAQVNKIKALLPENARVGTVDKFQGQEAPIVIYSMASSSSEDAPRGLSFLYSANRLNVAVSRAQCATIIVASPKIFEAKCHTPEQIKLVNAFSYYLELSTQII